MMTVCIGKLATPTEPQIISLHIPLAVCLHSSRSVASLWYRVHYASGYFANFKRKSISIRNCNLFASHSICNAVRSTTVWPNRDKFWLFGNNCSKWLSSQVRVAETGQVIVLSFRNQSNYWKPASKWSCFTAWTICEQSRKGCLGCQSVLVPLTWECLSDVYLHWSFHGLPLKTPRL